MLRFFFFFFLTLSSALLPSAAENLSLTASTLAEVEKTILQSSKDYGPKNTLVVFDLDDTLLTLSHQLIGSVAWFDWQEKLLQSTVPRQEKVAQSFSELLAIQQAIFATDTMQPEEISVAKRLHSLQRKNVALMIATARGPEMTDVTEKHLLANQLNYQDKILFTRSAVPMKNQSTSYQFAENDCPGLNHKKMIYRQGVLYLSGQNKAKALNCLLAQSNSHYQAVIFIDDTQKNIEKMCAPENPHHFKQLTCLHYVHGQDKQRLFAQSSTLQNKSHQIWQQRKKALLATAALQ